MSLTEFQIADVSVRLLDPSTADVVSVNNPDVVVITAGNIGPRGPAGKWEALTQNEYDLLNPPDQDTLYIIIQ